MMFPDNIMYTKNHKWVRIERNVGYVGITDFAQKELGEIIHIEVETLFNVVGANQVFGTIEAAKALSDLFMPLTGKVVEFNEKIVKNPELVNTDPYGDGWIIKIALKDQNEKDRLLTAGQYFDQITS